MHSETLFSQLAALAALTAPVQSWHTEVHNQIGFMADTMISEATRNMVSTILEPEYLGSLGRAGAWADTVRKGPNAYSYGWHFISAEDDPPNDCGLYYHRDCQKGGCVVQQIANQTNILERCLVAVRDQREGDSPGKIVCSEALKWITHFAGDVAQPLHTSERSVGGNSVKVKFNGTDTNLHQAWDREILYALAPLPNGLPATELHPFFAGLVSRIKADSFRAPRSTWAMCDLDARRGTYCAEQWAKDSNAIVCDYAYGRFVNGSDLLTGDDRYADGAFPIIEQQVSKAAFRLTGWLNSLVERVLIKGAEGKKLGKVRLNAQSDASIGSEL
ncbi:S1/P1 Nuclease [Seiridium cupressi]